MTSLTPQNAFPGIPFPLHVAIPTSDIFTGAVQPQGNSTVLTFKNAFPGVAFPQHKAGQSAPQNFVAPGAVQGGKNSGTLAPIAVSSSQLTSIFSGATTVPAWGINSHLSIDDGVGPVIPPATQVAMAQTLGASIVRIDATDWWAIESALETYDFAGSDPTLAALAAAELTTQLVLAYSNPLYESSQYTMPTDAAGINASAAYAKMVAARYGASLMIYEIGNEYNISNGAGQYASAPAANPSGFATLFNAMVSQIISVEPSAIIISGGLSPGAGSGYVAPDAFITTFVADATLTHVTGLGYHPYNENGTLPEQLITDCASFASAASNKLPIYVSEVGCPTGSAEGPTETAKAYAVARLMLSSLISQVKQCCIYEGISNQGYGLFSWAAAGSGFTYAPLPAATAFKSITGACAGMTSVSAAQVASAGLYEVTIQKASNYTRIVWANSGKSITYTRTEPAIASASAVDALSNPVPVIVTGDSVAFSVGADPVLLTITP